jgi:hypothetical protein
MHLNDLPKERLPMAPRTSKEPALHSILSCSLPQSMLNKYLKMQSVLLA